MDDLEQMPRIAVGPGANARAAGASAPSPAAGTTQKRTQRRGRPRRGEADRLNDDLLSHALDHFLEKGFEGTTIDAITRSLGMSKQTVYQRYGDKLTLFRAALARAIDEWLTPLSRLHELESDDLEQSLIDISRALVTTLLSPGGLQLLRITNAESYRMPEIGESTYKRAMHEIGQYLADLFRRRLPEAASSPEEFTELATTFLNLMSSPARVVAWGLAEDPVDVGEFIRRRVRLFLFGACSGRAAG